MFLWSSVVNTLPLSHVNLQVYGSRDYVTVQCS